MEEDSLLNTCISDTFFEICASYPNSVYAFFLFGSKCYYVDIFTIDSYKNVKIFTIFF